MSPGAIPPCPLCGSEAGHVLARGPDYEYRTLPEVEFTMWRCDSCGHGHLDPVPATEQLPEIYPATYYTVNPESPIRFSDALYALKMKRDVARIVSLAKGRPVRSVVDLGCGDGERLARVGEALGGGVELIGLDLQPDPARSEALARRGVRIVQANLEEELVALRDGGHDLAILCQILEHLRDPVAVLAEVARKLAPGGRVLVETPNLGGLDFHLFRKRYWGAYHTPRHFHLFTRETLEGAARRAGLELAARGFLPSGFGIVSVRSALGLDSIRRSDRFGEFLNMRSFLVVAAFSAVDLLWGALGGETSNQYLLAEKPADA